MNTQKTSHGTWLHNRGLLLILISAFSLLLFFLCLLFVPRGEEGGDALLRGSAVLLSLGMPSFFYLRSAGNEHAFALGRLPSARGALLRVLLFTLGALLLGLLFGTVGITDGGLFSVFDYPVKLSVSSLASLLAYAFGTAFLPFGLFAAHLSEDGRFGIVFPVAALYAAFAFSLSGGAMMLVFGILLALLYLKYRSFLTVFGANIAFLLGGYLGALSLLDGLPSPLFPLLLGVVAAALLFGSLDYALLCRIAREPSLSGAKKKWVLWSLFGILALLASSLLSLFVLKNIG